MNTKYKYFNFNLYKQIFKTITPVNLIFLTAFMLFTILVPIGTALSHVNTNKAVITYIDSNFYYLFIYTVYVPIITLYTFSFLTKRNASDYYHSFPYTRQSLFINHLAAILSWLIITLTSNTLVTIITYKALSKFFIINVQNILIFTLSIFICSLLVIAAILLACSVTGTLFTNIIVTALILFLPKFLIYIICQLITQSTPILVSDQINPLLSSDINLVFDISRVIFISEVPDYFSLSANIYTGLLAIIYFTAAYMLFKRRKSEVAGNPSSSKKMQGIIRIAIGLPISIIPVGILFSNTYNKANIIFMVIIGYIITFAGIVIFELISSKKFKNIIHCIPSLIIVIACNIVLYTALNLSCTALKNYKPAPEKIEYVTLNNPDYYYSYFKQVMSKHNFKDPEIINLVSEKLKSTVENPESLYNGNNTIICVGIKSDTFVKYRNIAFEPKEYEKLSKLLTTSPEVIDIYKTLPAYDKYSSHITTDEQIDEKASELIYNTLREELKNVDTKYVMDNMMDHANGIFLQLVTTIDHETVVTQIPLNMYTPKTLVAYMNSINENTKNHKSYDKIISTIENIVTNKEQAKDFIVPNTSYDITVTYFDEYGQLSMESGQYVSSYDWEDGTEYTQETYDVLSSINKSLNNPSTFETIKSNDKQTLAWVAIFYSDYSDPDKEPLNEYYDFFCYIDNSIISNNNTETE